MELGAGRPRLQSVSGTVVVMGGGSCAGGCRSSLGEYKNLTGRERR